MDMTVFGILDMKLGAFMKPFFMPNDGVAVRAFSEFATAADSEISKHPEDYCLYALGKFNAEKGVFYDLELRSLCCAADFS